MRDLKRVRPQKRVTQKTWDQLSAHLIHEVPIADGGEFGDESLHHGLVTDGDGTDVLLCFADGLGGLGHNYLLFFLLYRGGDVNWWTLMGGGRVGDVHE